MGQAGLRILSLDVELARVAGGGVAGGEALLLAACRLAAAHPHLQTVHWALHHVAGRVFEEARSCWVLGGLAEGVAAWPLTAGAGQVECSYSSRLRY